MTLRGKGRRPTLHDRGGRALRRTIIVGSLATTTGVCLLGLAASPSIASDNRDCDGLVVLSPHRGADNIRVKHVGCRKAKRVIKAGPASKGYECRELREHRDTKLCAKHQPN
jgi:hypothetical protein